ncbi:hypothetical protein [Sorangium sp. So ce204]|uniref:hypothetical protein n=1 Tax=Sorangium sp. So ce204 TaxID=3133288 RepID=UPI003F633FB3
MNRRNERGRVLGEQRRHVVQEFRNGQLLVQPPICSGLSGELVTPSMLATSQVLGGVAGLLAAAEALEPVERPTVA